jgi:cytochrome c1
MPANLVTGTDLEDVAHYLGTVAGNPKIKGPQLPDDPGAEIFAQQNCAGCHTLEAADASGTVGPDLDDVVPNRLKTAAAVREAIVDPNKDIAPGFPPNVMPQTYGQDLSPKELDDLVQFLLKYSGQKKGGSASGGGAAGGGASGSGSGSK